MLFAVYYQHGQSFLYLSNLIGGIAKNTKQVRIQATTGRTESIVIFGQKVINIKAIKVGIFAF